MNKNQLQGGEKTVVWIANIVNPLLAGFFFYYMWRKTYPSKANQANRISFIVAGVEILAYLIYRLIIKKV
jgi:hypothetical protein